MGDHLISIWPLCFFAVYTICFQTPCLLLKYFNRCSFKLLLCKTCLFALALFLQPLYLVRASEPVKEFSFNLASDSFVIGMSLSQFLLPAAQSFLYKMSHILKSDRTKSPDRVLFIVGPSGHIWTIIHFQMRTTSLSFIYRTSSPKEILLWWRWLLE